VVSEDAIQAAEARLGVRLPASYRAHLLASAGLPGDHGLTLLPVDEIDRFGRREPDWLAAWMEGYRSVPGPSTATEPLPDDPTDPATMPAEQLADTIVVSTTADMRLLLINPSLIDEAGEWEAWDFATWYPGAYRYPSFGRLVEALGARQ
jgi:hypothetical protein